MKGTFKNINAYTHQGRRDYQEDSYAFSDNFILVSDGVGGLAKGNIASEKVVHIWKGALGRIRFSTLHEDVKALVQDSISVLLEYAYQNTESHGMGATLACAVWIEDRLVAIHIGDSRIYHFNIKGDLIWRSKDHSLVQELIDTNLITDEEAINHPRRNVITRVLQAKEGHKTNASVNILNDVKDGDWIFVCTDGVNEAWSDNGLSSVLMGKFDIEKTLSIISEYCARESSDNNTGLLTRVSLSANNFYNASNQDVIINELSIPEPSIPEPLILEPSLPEPSLPEPSLHESSLPEPLISSDLLLVLPKSIGTLSEYSISDESDNSSSGLKIKTNLLIKTSNRMVVFFLALIVLFFSLYQILAKI